jgi:putative hemolysin
METNVINVKVRQIHDFRFAVTDFFNINKFKQKVNIYLERENFIIKTASNTEEVMKAIELRSQVFLEELNNKEGIDNIDIDEYDILSDHLLLIDREKNTVIGTYRFNSNLFSNSYYSEQEFEILNILTVPGIKVELGRACIHKAYRGGLTLSLLWTGLLNYVTKINADYLFGCSSFNISDRLHVAQLHKFFMEQHYSEANMRVFPKEKYKIEDIDLFLMEIENSKKKEYLLSQRFIPGLVKGYISAGAKICGEPIYDQDFNCYDFFTLLDLKKLNQDYVKLVTI